ncbi:MAG: phosphatase PAP2 family protein [Kiloniellaceae bacterium]
MERLAPAPQQGLSAVLPSARLALHWLFGLPNPLGPAIAIVALFSTLVLILAAVYGAPLSLPRERVSIALGYSAVLPVGAAIAIYSVLRLLRSLTRRSSTSGPTLLQMVATDLTLMTLFLVATYFHFSLKTWVQVINPSLYDEYYIAVDRSLQPALDLFYWIRTTYFTAVPNTDAWYQAAFLLMFISGFCSLAVTRNPAYPRFCIGVLLTMSLGAFSYLLAPALGPFIYEPGLNSRATEAQVGMLWAHKQVMQGGMGWIAEAGPNYFTGALAAMPSLHICHAAVMTYYVFQARSHLLGLFLLISFWVVIESVVSRWHYLIDLPAGLLLAALVIWLTNRVGQWAPAKRSHCSDPIRQV